MSTIRTIINKAFREAGITETGGEPEAPEFEEALDLLQGLYSSLFGNELGEPLTTVNYGYQGLSNIYAVSEDRSSFIDCTYVPSNVRVLLNVSGAKTLYLHPNPRDGMRLGLIDNANNLNTYNITLNGNGRQIEGSSTAVLNTAGLNREWFYRADLGTWARITDLTPDAFSPLPREFDDLLSTALAFRIHPRYGASTAQETSDALIRIKKHFMARYRQSTEVPTEYALWNLPSNRRNYFGYSTVTFNKGYPFG